MARTYRMSGVDIPLHEGVVRLNPDTDLDVTIDMTKAFGAKGGLPVPGAEDIIEPTLEHLNRLEASEIEKDASVDEHERGSIALASSYEGLPANTLIRMDTAVHWTSVNLKPYAQFSIDELRDQLRVLGVIMAWADHGMGEHGENELMDPLKRIRFNRVMKKGQNPTIDANSLLIDNRGVPTGYHYGVRERGKKRLFFHALAYDFCVGMSALDATKFDFESYLIVNLTRGIGIPNYEGNKSSIEVMTDRLLKAGVRLITTEQIIY